MRSLGVAALAATYFSFVAEVRGEPPWPCTNRLTADTVVRCALERSPEVRSHRLERDVVAGQRITAATALPQRPVLSFSAGPRWANGESAFDWYATLSQEIEIGGQRGLRLDEVDALSASAIRRLSAAEHEVAAEAASVYWRFVAGRQRLLLARDAARIAGQLGRFAQERRKEALLAPVDADIAESEAVQIGIRAAFAERLDAEATAELAMLLDLGPSDDLQPGDELPPVPGPEAPPDLLKRALTLRADLAAVEAESMATHRRVAIVEGERVPNPTLSVSFQRDGFSENFFSVGLSLPIPLPTPLVSSGAGDIARAHAQSLQSETQVAATRRRIELEVKRAIAGERSSAAVLRSFSRELSERARIDLDALGEALTARRMSIREALLAQRSLLELLALNLEARLQYRLARIELWRAAGLPLADGGRP